MKFLNLVLTPGDRPDYFVFICRTNEGCAYTYCPGRGSDTPPNPAR